jgi:sulfonate transport system ATP-binding protein
VTSLHLQAAVVAADGLRKSFGPREVLRDVHLRVGAGQFLAVVGPSGGGKTTLLRVLGGLEAPSAGLLTVKRSDDAAPTVRLMFQEDRLLPWKNVFDNVAIGVRTSDRLQRVEAALEAVGLGDRGREWPTVLSGGQRQRVALARALVHEPDLLLLDEPFGALDALTRARMQRLLEELWDRRRFTIVLVTHDPEEALLLADRVVVLLDGRVASDTRIDSPRPRLPGDARIAALKARVLEQLTETQQLVEAETCNVHFG